MKALLGGLFVLSVLAFSAPAWSQPAPDASDRVVINGGGIYANSDVTIPEDGSEGGAPVFIGGAPIFGGDGWGVLNIYLTEPGSDIISDHLFSGTGGLHTCNIAGGNEADCIFFASDPSTDPSIGTACTLGSEFCLEETGNLQDVTAMVTQQNGGLGIFGGGTISVESDIPEPASLVLLASGLAGLGLIRRRRRG
jgi:hypothetical protein